MARVLIVADIHSNIVALEAVLQDAARRSEFDVVWVLGDIVGYGPAPAECIHRVRELPCVSVAGNHDVGVAGAISLDAFNEDAARACRWTRGSLGRAELEWLAALPLTRVESEWLLVHGSPREPVWEYVTTADQAGAVLRGVNLARHCMAGHTHRPACYGIGTSGGVHVHHVEGGTLVDLRGKRYLINPGAVGQPRDGDPRAAYAVYDDAEETVVFYRVQYDVRAVSEAVLERGLPESLGARLHVGY